LLHILTIYPLPDAPQMKIFFPITSKRGFTCFIVSFSSDPTINVKVPFAAPVTPPLTGASMYVNPSSSAFLLSSCATVGSRVVPSIIVVPFLAF